MLDFRKAWIIALNTHREASRGKIFSSAIFIAALVVISASLFGTVTIGDQVKVIKDFGLFAISFSSVAFATIAGANLLYKELARKTIYNILSKSVQRSEFLLGKYLGLVLTSTLLIIILGLGLISFAALFEAKIDFLLFEAILFVILESLVLCSFAIFFSCIVVTPLLSGLFVLGVFIAGRSVEYLSFFSNSAENSAAVRASAKVLHVVLPRLDQLNHSDSIVYGIEISSSVFFWSLAYAVGYASILLLISNLVFAKREFN